MHSDAAREIQKWKIVVRPRELTSLEVFGGLGQYSTTGVYWEQRVYVAVVSTAGVEVELAVSEDACGQ